MKLIKIEHIRYEESFGILYLYAPDKIDEEIHKDIERAVSECIQEAKQKKDELPKPLSWDDFSDISVNEARKKIRKRDVEISEAINNQKTTSFLDRLVKLGYKELYNMGAPIFKAKWGHHHGLKLNYGKATKFFDEVDIYGF